MWFSASSASGNDSGQKAHGTGWSSSGSSSLASEPGVVTLPSEPFTHTLTGVKHMSSSCLDFCRSSRTVRVTTPELSCRCRRLSAVLCLLWYRYRLACLECPYVALPSCTLTEPFITFQNSKRLTILNSASDQRREKGIYAVEWLDK
jgi:hypothetical protein